MVEEIDAEGRYGNTTEDMNCSLVKETSLQIKNETPSTNEKCSSIRKNSKKEERSSS